jgi:hypothetical protein
MLAIEASCVVGGTIDESGHLILTKHDDSTIDAGAILGEIPNSSTTVRGVVQLATGDETTAGTNNTKVVTPLGLQSAIGTLIDAVNTGLQPKDADLTTIAGLTPANNDVIQRKAGAWINRTMVQLLADLVAVGAQTNEIYDGTTYGLAGGSITYIGDTDPGGSAADGSVWFDTSGD